MRKQLLLLATSLFMCIGAGAKTAMPLGADSNDDKVWTGTWATAVEYTGPSDMPAKSLSDRSVREIIHVSIGGDVLRMQLSNVFGNEDVEIRSVFIADAKDSCDIDVKSAKYLTFSGKKSVKIEAGKDVYSDNIAYNLRPLQRLSVTICYGKQTPEHATSHRGSRTTSYIINGEAKPKTNFVGDVEKVDHWYNIASLDVMAAKDTPVVAALGNSITDGRGTTTNLQNRWTDRLAEALDGKVGVLNLGIGGNSVLRGGLSQPALVRFDRDILGQSGVKTLIIYEGVNDIGGARENSQKDNSIVRANELIEAYKTMTEKAHAAGMKVYIATICPFKGNGYYTYFHDAARQTVNEWIRTQKVADGVIDFDAQVRDENDPAKLRKELSDDWLHLNPAGYKVMGEYAAKVLNNNN